jgi:hypothetical protein
MANREMRRIKIAAESLRLAESAADRLGIPATEFVDRAVREAVAREMDQGVIRVLQTVRERLAGPGCRSEL